MTSPADFRRALPPGATVSRWCAPDGWSHRRFDWPSDSRRGRILFQGGRGDVFEKYLESFSHWHALGWSITSFDWRGQGGSGRLSPDPHVGHAGDFGIFIADLAVFWRAWSAEGEGARALFGHSMGGHLALRALAEGVVDADAAVLVAPMLGLKSPLGAGLGGRLAEWMAGRGDPMRAAWKTNERPNSITSRQQLLTHDRSRYDDELWWYAEHPDIRLGPPSWAWLAEAFRSTAALEADARLDSLAVPVLMLVADADGLVDARAAVRIAARLPNGQIVRFGRESAHEILREADTVRNRALAAIDSFLDSARACAVNRYDVAIAGAGIAGASLAAAIAPHASVVLLETEDTPGYHATGRSAAFWSETYGGPDVQPLTTASGPLLRAGGFLEPLGSLHIGRAEDAWAIDAFLAEFAGSDVALDRVDPATIVPGLRSGWTLGVSEPSCAYIDVAALHAAGLATACQHGAAVMTRAALISANRASGMWNIETTAGPVAASILVNAAGAWADEVAIRAGVAPIGIHAYRRTIAQLRTDPPAPPAMPHVADIRGRFYFKPEAGGRLWLSPHDETLAEPGDAAPEEIDVAIAIDRFEQVVDWRVAAVERRWAGLRSFAPDRLPVYGFDAAAPGFFWCAGQGGFGIQTAPAAALLAAALLLGRAPDRIVADIDPSRYAPARFSANLR